MFTLPEAAWIGTLQARMQKLRMAFAAFLLLLLGDVVSMGEPAPGVPPFEAPADYMVQQWQTDEGLPQSTVTCLAQTPDGYLWAGTFNGLARFDGRRFVVFTSMTTPELPSNRIVRLYLDSKGRLWIGSEYGDVTMYADGKWTDFGQVSNRIKGGAFPDGGALILGEDGEGRFWICGSSTGDCYILMDGKFVLQAGVRRVSTGAISSLLLKTRASFWDSQGNVITWLSTPESNQENGGRFLLVAQKQELGIWARAGAGIVKWRKNRVERYLPASLLEAGGGSVREDDRGNVWVACPKNSLLYFDRYDHPHHLVIKGKLEAEGIRAFCLDREGNIWLGCEANGLLRLTPRVFRNYGVELGLANKLVKSITEDKAGNIWAASGTQMGLLHSGEPPVRNPSNLALSELWSVNCDRSGIVWIGTWGGGLFKYENQQVMPVLVQGVDPKWVVKSIFQDRRGVVWAGGKDVLVRIEENQARKMDGPYSANMDLRAFADDSTGRLYAGLSRGGLLRLEGNDFRIFKKRDGLPSENILSLYTDNKDVLWIGTFEAGLGRLKQGAFYVFPFKLAGLPGNIASILEDDAGRLWFGSSEGIFRVLKAELNDFAEGRGNGLNVVQYTRAEGLGITECANGQQPAAWRAKDGKLWFATLNGISVVNPNEMPSNGLPPPLVIENIIVDGRNAGTGGRALAIPAGSHSIEIHYSALSLTAPEKVRFKYRLDGLDRNWKDVGGRREAYFQGLRPGPYRFRMIACNNDGVWSQEEAVLAFAVQPHYWETAWFRLCVLTGAIVAVAGFARYLALRKLRLRLAVLERQHALDQERARIARDMHDGIGSSLTRITMLGEISEKLLAEPVRARDSIQKLTRASRDVVGMMDEILWALNPKNDNLENVATYIAQFARDHLSLANIQCRLDLPMDLPPVILNSDARRQLLLAVKEALNNVVKHSAATEAKIQLRVEKDMLDLSIIDNGRGFAEGVVSPGSDGLENMPLRLAKIGGRLSVKSQVGHGTEVHIRLPLPTGSTQKSRISRA